MVMDLYVHVLTNGISSYVTRVKDYFIAPCRCLMFYFVSNHFSLFVYKIT